MLSATGGAPVAAEDATGTVDVVEYTPHRVELSAQTDADGWVVLGDTYFPGWYAWVDGEETPVLRADWALRAVYVPAGEHQVVLEYRSRSFEIGMWVSAMSVIVVAGLWLWDGRRRGERDV